MNKNDIIDAAIEHIGEADAGYTNAFLAGVNWLIRHLDLVKWYDNIPKHGVLCWVWDGPSRDEVDPGVEIITQYQDPCFLTKHNVMWDNAEPLTDQEIKQFLRGDV